MIEAARECSAKDRRHGHPGGFQFFAKLQTTDHIDRETPRRSSATRHRSPRYDQDRVCVRGERIREALAVFPLSSIGYKSCCLLHSLAVFNNQVDALQEVDVLQYITSYCNDVGE